MRHVNRGSVAPPPSLTLPDGLGAKERLLVQAHYTLNKPKTYKFKAYKSADVKLKLEQLFHRKCAYCESPYGATAPVDVEHFRPKGRVTGEDHHRGYWWLASDWNNLLPSCIDCNRKRLHRAAQLGMTRQQLEKAKRALSGKRDLFPIRAHARAACPTDRIEHEDPLLIDPTSRDPSTHLSWHVVNGLSIVAPTAMTDSTVDPYGAESIAIYGLNRQGLVEERTRLMLAIKAFHGRLLRSIERALGQSGSLLSQQLLDISEDMNDFARFMDPEQPYSSCARAYVEEAISDIKSRLEKLASGQP